MSLPTEVPSAANFGILRAKLAQFGFSQSWIDSVIGTSPAGRTRAEISALLKAAMYSLPKG